ncbi:MAG TPA: penicillin-binding protein activator [Alphaproteobacteria bacterium]|nr:penicillin-binding protein activator [Alphaproteobacteria bacterium]
MRRLLAGMAVAAALVGCAPQQQTVQAPLATPQVPPPVVRPVPPPLPEPIAPPPAPLTAEPLQPLPPAGPTKVALLLPLSGQNRAVGQALLEAAQLAVIDEAPPDFELVPVNTDPNALRAAEEALGAGASLVLGPLFGAEAAAIRPVTAGRVDVLTYSTDFTVAGDGVFVTGYLPQQQVERVVGYALSRGATRFAALLPNSAYGQAVGAALQAAAERGGGGVLLNVTYDTAATDLSPQIQQLATLDLGTTLGAQQRLGVRPGTGGGLPYDVLFVAEGGARLRALLTQLKSFDLIGRAQLAGTGLWDDPALYDEPLLQGGWFAAPPPDQRADFERRYAEAFGARPPRIAALGYDTTAMAARLAKSGGMRPFDRARLTDPAGFQGVDGPWRLTPDFRNERALAVLEMRPGGPAVVDPAPRSVAPLGF